jgi:arylsulfatase A-like enzyme
VSSSAVRGGGPLRAFALLLAAALAGLTACGGTRDAKAPPPERVVLVVVDTLRRDHLGCYGSANPTPNIDALAARGQRFSNYTAAFHQTSMSMGALFTGRTPSLEFNRVERPLFWNSSTWCGLNRFAAKGDDLCLPPTLPTLAEALREAGYRTIGIASNQFLYEPSGFSRGFDDWVEVGKKPEADGALARLKLPDASKTRYFGPVNRAALEALDRRESDRFFLYVHYMDVHDYGNTASGRYAKGVRSVDWAVGDLLAALAERELLEGAVVILTSDHGERLGERHAVPGKPGHTGNPSFQEVLAVPLIVAPATRRDPAVFLRTQDLFGLILEIVGGVAETDADLQADELYLSETEYRTYLHGRWKSAVRRSDGQTLLFDLEADPGEQRDVAGEHPEVAERHRARTDELSERLSARRAVLERLSEDDRERLRALGYLEQLENPR